MTSRDFAFWCQGFFELTDAKTLTETQVQMIKNHLNLVFKHEIDPAMGNEEHQVELNKIHNGDEAGFTYTDNYLFPKTEKEATAKWGPKPSPNHKFNLHGWYDPEQGVPRC